MQLKQEDLAELEAGLARLEIYGGRMDARQMKQIGWDDQACRSFICALGTQIDSSRAIAPPEH